MPMKKFSFILFSMFFMYFFFTGSILIVFNDSVAAFNIFSFEVLGYFSRLCTYTYTHFSTLITVRPPHPLHLCKYSLSTSALGWCVPHIVISFLVSQSSSSSSIFVQRIIPAPYLTMETTLELTVLWL